MKKCWKCGLEIGFERIPSGKWSPVNPDGSSHWDLCRAAQNSGDVGLLARDAAQMAPRMTHGEKVTHVYGLADIAPWDESLGEFRWFTAEEKALGLVCFELVRP